MSEQNCPDCRIEMEEGFLPLSNPFANLTINPASWYRGEPEQQLSFGFIKGGVKYDRKQCLPISAYRCTKCGLLRFYAQKADDK